MSLKRCEYLIVENYRILKAFATLSKNNLKFFSKLMCQNHNELSKDYKLSCKELKFIVEFL